MSNKHNIALSINLNKIALIRNSREGNNPDILEYAQKCIDYGSAGITVHPRPDQRHIRPEDCVQLKALVEQNKQQHPGLEFNIEGNPSAEHCATARGDFSDYPGFIEIIRQCQPDQATLVPDADGQLTSDHGFDLSGDTRKIENQIAEIKQIGSRVSLFMDPDLDQISRARDIGADRIELYTGPFAEAFMHGGRDEAGRLFESHCRAAEHATDIGLGVNAGHDLNLDNLAMYRELPGLLEVSIGHALTIDSLEYGLKGAVSQYLYVLAG